MLLSQESPLLAAPRARRKGNRAQGQQQQPEQEEAEAALEAALGAAQEAEERRRSTRAVAVAQALRRAVDLTVGGDFRRRQDAKVLSRQTAEELMAQVLQQTDQPTEPEEDAEDVEESVVEKEGAAEGDDEGRRAEEKGEESQELVARKSGAAHNDHLQRRVEALKDQEVVLWITNLLLQRKIGQISVTRKDVAPAPETPTRRQRRRGKPGSPDPKKRYRQALEQYERLKDDLAAERRRCEEDLAKRRAYHRSLEDQLGAERRALLQGVRRCAETLPLRSTGAPLRQPEREELVAAVERKFAALHGEHARFVRTARRLRAAQAKMRSLDIFGERKHLADLEQLVEDNQKLKQRVDDRGLLISTVRARGVHELQEAAHMRDMIQGTEEDIDALVRRLAVVDDRLESSREAVAKAKRRRDCVRRRTRKVLEELDLLAFPPLLQHFQDLRRATEEAQAALGQLERAHRHQEQEITLVRARLLKLSAALHEKLPEDVLDALSKRTSMARVAAARRGKEGEGESDVLLKRHSLVSLGSGNPV